MTSSIAPAVERPVGWLALLIGWALALLGACGGTDGDAPIQIRPEPDVVTITAYSGVPNVTSGGIRVYGVQGVFRAPLPTAQRTFTANLTELTGPYAIGLLGNSDETGDVAHLVSVTTRRGIVNVTPLTTLAVAQLFGRDPTMLFSGLLGAGDPILANVTEVKLIDAQARVRRYLQREFGFTLGDDVGDFFTAPFSPAAGDPMFDAIVALNTRLAELGTDVFAVGKQIAAEANFCNLERLVITMAGEEQEFCPALKSSQPDEADPTVTNYRFTDSAGTVLTVVGRGADVLSATLSQSEGGPVFTCSGAGCTGIALGTPAGDLSRPINFSGVRLAGASGMLGLDGTLQANPPGAFFPPLLCDNRYYVAYPDGRVDAACAAPDPGLGAGFGSTAERGVERRSYTFSSDGSFEPLAAALEVVAEPDGVVSVLVQDTDPATGELRTLFKCRGADCNGVTLGPVRDDADSFAPLVLRNRLITLDDTVLTALNPAGTPSAVGSATVRASLDSFEVIFPGEFVFLPCASPSQRLTSQVSDETVVIEECPPAEIPPEAGVEPEAFLRTAADAEGNLTFFISSFVYQPSGSFGPGPGITINLSNEGVVDVTYPSLRGSTFRCVGSACTGVTVSAPDAAGERTISFSGAVLQEIETAGLIGDRTATINGSFTAPPPGPL